MKISKYFIILLFLIPTPWRLLALDIDVEEVIEVEYKITEADSLINIPIKIFNGIGPYNFIIYPSIDKEDAITGVLADNQDTVTIAKNYYNKPGVYITRIIIQDSNNDVVSKDIYIIYYQPYLPDPIVAIHGFMGTPRDYYSDSFKYIFNFLRGDWDESDTVFNGGYDLVCVANQLNSDTSRISDSYKELYDHNTWADSREGYLVGYEVSNKKTNDIYKYIFNEGEKYSEDMDYRSLRWIPLAKKMWRYTFLRRYGALPEDFGLPENPKVALLAGSMGGLVARAYIQSPDYQNDVSRFIDIGTPHKGVGMVNGLMKLYNYTRNPNYKSGTIGKDIM